MAYEAHTWVDNELVTKDKLNHIEEGIANTGYYIDSSTGRSFNIDLTGVKVPQMSTSVTSDSLTNTAGHGTVYFRDSDGHIIGYIRQTVTSTTSGLYIHAAIEKSNGTTLFQTYFGVAIDRSTGEASYTIQAPGSFRDAIGSNTKTIVQMKDSSNATTESGQTYNAGMIPVKDSANKALGEVGVAVITNSTSNNAGSRGAVYAHLRAHGYNSSGNDMGQATFGVVVRESGEQEIEWTDGVKDAFRKQLLSSSLSLAEIQASTTWQTQPLHFYSRDDKLLGQIVIGHGGTVSGSSHSGAAYFAVHCYSYGTSGTSQRSTIDFEIGTTPDGAAYVDLSSNLKTAFKTALGIS